MRCYICNSLLLTREIIINKTTKKPEPCSDCMNKSLGDDFLQYQKGNEIQDGSYLIPFIDTADEKD